MAIQLKLEHVAGLRLRQQVAHSVARSDDSVTSPGADPSQKSGQVILGKDWKFEKEPETGKDAVVPRDKDPRKQTELNTYSVTIAAGLRNLVAEKQGPVQHVTFRNSSIRTQIKIKNQLLAPTGRKAKDGTDIKEWKDAQTTFLPAGEWGGVAIGDGMRAVLEEMPT